MYPGRRVGITENHKKGICLDAVPVHLKPFTHVNGTTELAKEILWPQPEGIFGDNMCFNVLVFLQAIHQLYEKAVVDEEENLGSEYDALAKMCADHCVTIHRSIHYPIPPQFKAATHQAISDTVVMHNDIQHVRIDCLKDNDSSSNTF